MKFNTQLTDLPSTAIRRPVLIVVLNLLIIIAGLAAINGVEVRELPDVDRPIITVTANFPGAAPETVDTEVTRHLEGAVARVSGVKSIRASSEEGNARIVVEFRPGIDLDNAANETRESVSRVQRQLPEEVENVAVIKADNDAESVVSLSIWSDEIELEALTERVEVDLAPNFLSVSGVADVRLTGDRRRVMRVVIDPLRLSSYGLAVTDVSNVLRQAAFDVPAGSLKSTDQQVIVRADASSVTEQQVADIMINDTTRVGDVADVYFAPADARSYQRLDGKPVLGLGIIRQARSNTIEISDDVLALAKRLDEQFTDLNIEVTSDDAKFIRSSVEEVITSLGLTILLVIATLWIFIGSGRATIIPAAAIPVALVGTISVIWLMGFSVNILTLLALVLATGLVVDDAIVVSENIQRRRAMGMGARAAAVIGTREVFFAVVATTAVLVAVFVPIAFLPSTAGRLFREFGGVLAAAVIISSFVALSLVPALTARLPLKEHKETFLTRVGSRFLAGYRKSLHVALDKAWWVFIASTLVAGTATYLYTSVDNELMPSEDRGMVRIFARGPDGVGLNFMDRQAQKMEDILLPYVDGGAVESISTSVGQWDPNMLFITVRLTDWEERDISQQEIIDEISEPLSRIPGSPARAFGSNSLNLRGQGGGLEVALTGEDYQEIFEAAQKFSAALQREMPEVGFPRISFQPTQPQLRVNIDRKRAEELGVPLSDISTTLRAAVNGDDITDLNIGDQAVPVMLMASREKVNDPSDLANLYVGSSSGELVPMSSLASITEEGVAAELERRAQRRAIEIDMALPEELAIEDAVEKLREIADRELPSNVGMVLLGEAEAYEETAREVMLTYVLAFVIVFLVLAAQFESVNSAVVVMATVPFGIAAAFFALYVTGTSINIFSQIGLVMLIGLIAKNSILLVEFADQLRDQGKSVREAVEQAAQIRLRPIMMTLISTLLGSVPLIISIGAGAEARNAIGWVVFGGLAFAILFTLYLAPVLYLALARFTKPRADESQRLEREMESASEFPD
ncbi:multidrug transporter AcrB [Pseudidiomarina aestuarii]|uniref:Multidrug transporter AcrB n=1 Tax=Pseudidiomarina aestuarii TaxID=624146 RepID=A0A2T4D3P9_9GAMM|nr:multidrug transporter AcrB [Pseudidiomarina aestuarii]PTB86934.1 multidrug transporter AcrB [Pseudidiomarina aestuarii]PTB88433.1 multidrug transporter AcrB [Pseudidiomarina aestuarii]PTB89565.1 multidrug transporter AcrB [Pseudidiomarina aestuarii]